MNRVSIDVTNTYQPDFGVTLHDDYFVGEKEESLIGIADYQPGDRAGFSLQREAAILVKGEKKRQTYILIGVAS